MAELNAYFELPELSTRMLKLDQVGKCGPAWKRISLATKLCDELIDAAEKNNLEAVEHLLDNQHVPIYWTNANRQTAAHIAVEKNNLVLLEYLLKKDMPALVGAEDKRYRTPLHLAAALGNFQIVKFLIEKCKLPCNLVNSVEMSVLYVAAAHGTYRTLVYLIEHGADVNFGTLFNDTPLHVAARKNYVKIVQYLVEKGNADVNARNVTGDTALHGAVKTKKLDTVKYLIEECKASPLVENAQGENALFIAIHEECHDITEYMVLACNLSGHRDLIQAYIEEIPKATKDIFREEVVKKEGLGERGGRKRQNIVGEAKSRKEKQVEKKYNVSERITRRRLETKLQGRAVDEEMRRGAKFERHLRALQTTMILNENDSERNNDIGLRSILSPYSANRYSPLRFSNVANPSEI